MASSAPVSWHILLVEDEPSISGPLERALRGIGHTVTRAESATNALLIARTELPDLILLDVHLEPGDTARTGFDVLQELKRDPLTADIAVIMVTAVRGEGHIVAALQQADDYVTKPFSIGELTARINAVMRRAGARARTHGSI